MQISDILDLILTSQMHIQMVCCNLILGQNDVWTRNNTLAEKKSDSKKRDLYHKALYTATVVQL